MRKSPTPETQTVEGERSELLQRIEESASFSCTTVVPMAVANGALMEDYDDHPCTRISPTGVDAA